VGLRATVRSNEFVVSVEADRPPFMGTATGKVTVLADTSTPPPHPGRWDAIGSDGSAAPPLSPWLAETVP